MSNKNGTKIGLVTATIVCMNAMIGSGIFTAPATMASSVGPAGILAYSFVVCAVWLIALSLARLSYLFPEEGSFYTYTKQWAGHTGGLVAGFLYISGLLIAMGLLTHIATFYLHSFFPHTSLPILGFVTLIILISLNMFGVVLSQLGQYILITCTLFPLLATTVLCLFHADFSNLFPFAPYGFQNIFKATRTVIFGFFGFESATSLFTIVYKPEKTVPRALTYSIILVGLIYTVFIASIILSVPLTYFTDQKIPLSEILSNIFPNNRWLIVGIHISILSAVLGTIHSMIWSSSALTRSLFSKINCIQHYATKMNLKTNENYSVLFIGVLILTAFITLHNLDLFFCLTAIGIVSAYILSLITLLTLKKEWRSGQNSITLGGVATALLILYYSVEGLVQELIKMI